MLCAACGGRIDSADAAYCALCGAAVDGTSPSIYAPPASPPTAETIPTYLAQSILVTLCCCTPVGLVAVVYSAHVSGKIEAGKLDEARRYSRLAYIWGWISFGIGAGVGLVYLITVVAGGWPMSAE